MLRVRGTIPPGGSVTVNGQAPDRTDGTVFTKTLPVNNASASQWIPVTVTKTPASGSPVSVTTTNFVPAATETLSYDLDGNLISDGQFVYAYDGENRLILVESRAGTPSALKRQIHYSYDGEGRLIRRYVNREMSYEYMPGATVTWWAVMESHRYLHDGWMCLAEYAPSASDQLRLFVWDHDLSGTRGGAGGIGGLCLIHDSVKGPLFLGSDRMGNIVHTVSGSTGDLVATTEYRSFGDVVEGPSGSMVPGFSSKLRDSTSGLNYFGYRWYGAKHGRWVNRDPIEEQGHDLLKSARDDEADHFDFDRGIDWSDSHGDELNLYGFVLNNSVNYLDPHGEAIWVPVVVVGSRIAIQGYRAYRSITKARKALAKVCNATWVAYKASCNVGCKGTTCEELSMKYKAALVCAEGRSLYISIGCDDVGRGYGAQGRLNPRRRADRATHQTELGKAEQLVKDCRAKRNKACCNVR